MIRLLSSNWVAVPTQLDWFPPTICIANKSDLTTLGTTAQLRLVAAVATMDVSGSSLPVKSEIKSLGVIIDSFDKHATAVASASNHTHTPCLAAANRRNGPVVKVVM